MAKTRRRKKRTHRPSDNDVSQKNEPRTFVFRRGRHSAILQNLEQDLRQVMLPNTAVNLKESRRNTLKDFVAVAGPLGVSHFMVLSMTNKSPYLRVCKTPRGPTLTFKVHEYALVRDVTAAQQRPRVPQTAFRTAPLVVMNGFGGDEHLKLATVMFQNIFPPINVTKTKLSSCQRVVLLSYDKATQRVSFRHYTIAVAPSGIKKSLKGLLQRKTVPDLGDMNDVSEFVMKSGYGSESEGEDAEASRVLLSQDLGKGNMAAQQSRVRLYEVGPRLDMELIKVQEGLSSGKVLYHAYHEKEEEEEAALDEAHESKRRLKEDRKREQEENVQRKEQLKKAKRVAKAAGGDAPRKKRKTSDHGDDADVEVEADDDVEYFKQEVGREPDADDRIGRGSTSGGPRPSFGSRGGGRGRGGRSSGGRFGRNVPGASFSAGKRTSGRGGRRGRGG